MQWESKWSKQLMDTKNPLGVIEAVGEIFNIDPNNFSEKELVAMLSRIEDVIKQPQELQRTFILNEKEYGIIPNFSQMKFSDMINLDGYLQSQDILNLFSVLYREVKKKNGQTYTIKKYNGLNEEFKDLPLGVVEGALSFFYRSFQQLSPRFQPSFLQQKEMMMKMK